MDGLISIGRNIREVPMSQVDWVSYVVEVQEVIVAAGGVVHGSTFGSGEWDGITEESAYILFSGAELQKLEADLPVVAAMYRQEAIGLLMGVLQLVSGADARVDQEQSDHG